MSRMRALLSRLPALTRPAPAHTPAPGAPVPPWLSGAARAAWKHVGALPAPAHPAAAGCTPWGPGAAAPGRGLAQLNSVLRGSLVPAPKPNLHVAGQSSSCSSTRCGGSQLRAWWLGLQGPACHPQGAARGARSSLQIPFDGAVRPLAPASVGLCRGAVGGAAGGGGAAARGGCRQLLVARSVWQDSRGYQHFQGRGHAFAFASGPRGRLLLAAVVVGGLSYYLYCLETIPYTGRRHAIMLVSAANEQWMGKRLFEDTLREAAAEGRLLPPTHPDVRRVARLGQQIAAVAGDGGGGGAYGHMRGLAWEFAVVDNPAPNAFVVPGGKVVVFTGLLRLLGSNDDELAAVLAHEVGHVLARHPAERMSTLNTWALLNAVLRLTLGLGLPNVAMVLGLFLPYSRLAEHEADVIGLRLMARACFDPSSAPLMLAKLNSKEKQMEQAGLMPKLPAFLRTHPLTEDRVALVKRELDDAYKMYYSAGCGERRGAFARGMEALGWGTGSPGGGEAGESFRFG